MRLKRLFTTLLAPCLAIAVYGCADTDTPDVEYEANRPIYEDETAVTEDPAMDEAAPGATTEWDQEELNATDPTAPATDPTTQPPATQTPDATGTTPPDASEEPGSTTTPPASEGTAPASEDVEEEPASDLPADAESPSDSEGAQP